MSCSSATTTRLNTGGGGQKDKVSILSRRSLDILICKFVSLLNLLLNSKDVVLFSLFINFCFLRDFFCT